MLMSTVYSYISQSTFDLFIPRGNKLINTSAYTSKRGDPYVQQIPGTDEPSNASFSAQNSVEHVDCFGTQPGQFCIYSNVMPSNIDSQLQPAAIPVRLAFGPTCVTPWDHQIVPLAVPPSKATFVPVANVRV